MVDVAMTYRAFTLRRGTPLTLNGPVTRRTPWGRCLRRTTRLPRKRPARRMTTVPGVREARGFAGRTVLRAYYGVSYGRQLMESNNIGTGASVHSREKQIPHCYGEAQFVYCIFLRGRSTYSLLLGDVLSRVVFGGLLGVMRYRPLSLAKLLRRWLIRHGGGYCGGWSSCWG